MKYSLHSFLVATCVAIPAWAAKLPDLQAGEQAPSFNVTDMASQPARLKQWRGHPVVLEWTNFRCPAAAKLYETGLIPSLQQEVTAAGGAWLTILSADRTSADYLKNEQASTEAMRLGALPTAILPDPEGTLAKLFRVGTGPVFFVLDGDGTLIYRGAFDNSDGKSRSMMHSPRDYVREAFNAALNDTALEVMQSKALGCQLRNSSYGK